MNWSSGSEFIAMGGYGLYVWGSFGVTAAVLLGEVVALRMRRDKLRRAEQERHHEPAPVEFSRSPHEA